MGLTIWMVFEAVAPDQQNLEDSLEDHLEKLGTEEGVEIIENQLDEVSEIENPHPGLEKGFSQVCETRVDVESFAKAVELIINYGPTYIQIEEPDRIELDLKEGQEALQNVANTMHQYAQMGAGGVLISKADED